MIVQAGPLFAYISWKISAAAPQVIQLMDQVDRVPDSLRTCIRPEIAGLIFKHLSRQHYPRENLVRCHFDKRIGLVVHEHRIIFRMMLFDQIALQYERLKL